MEGVGSAVRQAKRCYSLSQSGKSAADLSRLDHVGASSGHMDACSEASSALQRSGTASGTGFG